MQSKPTIFWFRRDLRLRDNVGLCHALSQENPLQAIFIFDPNILMRLPRRDRRVAFIHQQLEKLDRELKKRGSGIRVFHEQPLEVFKKLVSEGIAGVFCNRDYEPYAIQRDKSVADLLEQHNLSFSSFKDQVIFEGDEIRTGSNTPYHVFTPYSRKWLASLRSSQLAEHVLPSGNFMARSAEHGVPKLEIIGFDSQVEPIKAPNWVRAAQYDQLRDSPSEDASTGLGPHLRFGTLSVREVACRAQSTNDTLFKQLIWREFFMQILAEYPHVVERAFRPQFDLIEWLDDPESLQRWKEGTTGFPLVDAGMRELNASGKMHNRVRMVCASFLVKQLLCDWRIGEAYFAEKLLDFELAANNGNWQWCAGTGCDAAPYFRIFNPISQQKKFDPNWHYIKKWVPEWGTPAYPEPMVDLSLARQRALDAYSTAKGKYEKS